MKYNFSNIKIGDRILTDDGKTGKIVMIRSYAYINDLVMRNAADIDTILIDLLPFKFDNVRHQNIDYPAVTIAMESIEYGKKVYYLVDIDFNDIKRIITEAEEIIEPEKGYMRFLKFIHNYVNKYINAIKNKFKNYE